MVLAIIVCFVGAVVIPSISGNNLPCINKGHYIVNIDSENEAEILKEIEETVDKVLVVDEIIGDKQVKYWEHAIDYVFVKNDFILLHIDTETGVITNYERRWTDVELDLSNLGDIVFEPNNYFWKKAVVFPNEDDRTYFYTFYNPQEYPVVSWEVRHTDGTTILYNFDGAQIGHGIPTPNKGFSLSGYNDASWPDPWIDYRTNADFWFSQWCDTTTSLSLPTPSTISSYVSDPNVMYFYELAHGDEFSFQAEAVGSSYTATMVQNDMMARQPMELAFIGSCHGLTSTGPGTFSYEFRKGQMTNTVTIGYDYMETCPGWQYAIPWQDSMFENMNKGFTMKASFDMATALYPTIAPAVVFLGDQNLVVPLPPSKPSQPSGPPSGKIKTTYSYSTSTIDPNGDKVKYGWDWNGDNIVDQWDDNNGNYHNSGTTIAITHSWDNEGTYNIKVKAEDINGAQSEWSDPLSVTMPKNKPYIKTPFINCLENHPLIYQLLQRLLKL